MKNLTTTRVREIPYLEQLKRAKRLVHKDSDKYLSSNEEIYEALKKRG